MTLRNGADDAQFGKAPQEQWLYSGVTEGVLSAPACRDGEPIAASGIRKSLQRFSLATNA
jgi:hypothetical protein